MSVDMVVRCEWGAVERCLVGSTLRMSYSRVARAC